MEKTWDHKKEEEEIYKRWEEAGVFKASKTGEPYTILMPPPNANASLHAGHGMYTVEDVLIRWKRMQGYSTLWQPGVDHAGFETQFVYEKYLKKQGKSRFDFDRESLYKNVAKFVDENSGQIYKQFKRLGFGADWKRSVFTLDKKVRDCVLNTFKKMANDNLIYRSNYLVNYCNYCGTSLSELETDHKDRVDPLYFIKYGPITVATTRPETMFGDVAVAVNPKDKRYKNLIGKLVKLPFTSRRIPIIADEMVDMEFGTGAVKITPAHDQNDFEVGKRAKLKEISVIDLMGKMRLPDDAKLEGIEGMKVRMARDEVIRALVKEKLIEKIDEKYSHSVMVCYKCGRDLEPSIIPNWFVKVKTLKKPVIKAVNEDKVKFYPKRFKKQMLSWLAIMHDWPISRQIAWGIRIPAWYKLETNGQIKISFIDKKGERVNGLANELLKQYDFGEIENGLQNLIAPNEAEYIISETKPKGNYLQETDTFDTWFSSGQWPMVTLEKQEYKTRLPTDVMGTLHEILRFWVSRMMMFSLYLENKIPFKDVYLWSMVADKKGKKMSKSSGNVVNPIELVDKYGADAFRFSLLYGTAQGSKIILSEDKVRAMRNFSNKIWNAARFIENSKIQKPRKKQISKSNDQVFKQRLNEVTKKTTEFLEKYEFGLATEFLYQEFWHWYCDECIEKNKKGEISNEALLEGLKTFLKLLHPFVPFVTEAVWQEMKFEGLLVQQRWPSSRKKNFTSEQIIFKKK
ncbi:valine--tRNA ligase [Patescibacteria group bacterium]|nr:valine--tRNA ligase [Patescibacteria group bacterium]